MIRSVVTSSSVWKRSTVMSVCLSLYPPRNNKPDLQQIFTARCYAMACVCLCLSVTSRSSTKTAKRRITQTTPHDSPGSLVFWCQRSPRNSTGVTAYEGAKCRCGGSKSATRQIIGYISKTVKDRHIVSNKVE